MFTLNAKGKLLPVTRPLVMGIINRAPDSFYSGSRFPDNDSLLQQVEKMAQEGADWLDIGGQNNRPGAPGICGEKKKQPGGGAIPLFPQPHRPALSFCQSTCST